jgi:hypothetical protein
MTIPIDYKKRKQLIYIFSFDSTEKNLIISMMIQSQTEQMKKKNTSYFSTPNSLANF